jgi:hypothetical protein
MEKLQNLREFPAEFVEISNFWKFMKNYRLPEFVENCKIIYFDGICGHFPDIITYHLPTDFDDNSVEEPDVIDVDVPPPPPPPLSLSFLLLLVASVVVSCIQK